MKDDIYITLGGGHPSGTKIQTIDGEKPVEQLGRRATITSWNRDAQKPVAGRHAEIRTSTPPGNVFVYDIAAGEHDLTATGSQRFLCRWTNRRRSTCVTYLMHRRGFGFRVGWCQLFAKTGMLHLAHRARIERADQTWILAVHESRTDASAYESIVATRYALPTVTFEPVFGAQHLTTPTIRTIFRAVRSTQAGTNIDNGIRCLADHEREAAYPLYPWPGLRLGQMQGRRTYFEVHASNLMPELMSVPLLHDRNAWQAVDRVRRRVYTGPLYRLTVASDHNYSANGIVTLDATPPWRSR